MRKVLAMLIIVCGLLCGCMPVSATEKGNFIVSEQLPWDGYILIDKVTGVEYLVINNSNPDSGMAITPRLNADGSLFTASQE